MHEPLELCLVAGSVQLSRDGKLIRVHTIRQDRAEEQGEFANLTGWPRKHPAPAAAPRLKAVTAGRSA